MESQDRLDGLEVLVVGVDDLISRDVICALVTEGATVTAAAGDEFSLHRLQRDLGLYRTTVNIAHIDLLSSSEMRLYADNLRGQRKLPHLVVCCRAKSPSPSALALSFLQPSLVVHALPQARTRLGRAIAALNLPSLPALLARGRRGGLFDPHTEPKRVLISNHVFTLRRWEGSPGRAPTRRGGPSGDRATAANRNPPPEGLLSDRAGRPQSGLRRQHS